MLVRSAVTAALLLPQTAALTGSARVGSPLPMLRHQRAPELRMVEMPRSLLDQLLNPLRRQVYTTLSPIDRGEFKWEFLVPWVNRTLTASDKFIICSTFIGISFTLQTVFDPVASVGVHLSYIAQFFSFAMGDPIGFRTLAVLTSVLEILGDLFETKSQGLLVGAVAEQWWDVDAEDIFPVAYNIIFVVINGYYILRWLLTREALLNALEWSEVRPDPPA